MTLKDNNSYGHPRSEYLDALQQMDDAKLQGECKNKVWLSAYANNNPRSDYHWQADACYDECVRRGKVELYQRGWDAAYSEAGYSR